MKIFSSEQIRKVDAETISSEGISSLELMKRAATAFCSWFTKKYTNKQSSIVIFSGVGNNGGDGLVIARILHKQGYKVEVFIVEYSTNYSDDCAHNLRRIKAEKISCKKIIDKSDILDIEQFDIVIDAVFGTGLSRKVTGIAADVIEQINNFSVNNRADAEQPYKRNFKRVISIDVPSGLFLDRNTSLAVMANETVTFQIPKLSLFLPDNYQFTGNVTIVDIGLNEQAISEIESNIYYTEKIDVKALIKTLGKFAHKGTEGHALIIGGSFGKIGSVCLATRAALKTGCGLITAYVPKCGVQVLQSGFAEAMVVADSGSEHISNIEYNIKPDAIGIGIGMGQHNETVSAFSQFLHNYKGALVIDADGINILAKHKYLLQKLPPKTILTPHPKELSRLIGDWSDDFDKINKTVDLAQQYDLIIVIKGAYSIIIDANNIYVNSTGTPALATAGSGDVLTGMITSLLAQRYRPIDAARVGVYLHGMTANITSHCIHPRSFIASDIIENISDCYRDIDY